jgi:hypothetical protein
MLRVDDFFLYVLVFFFLYIVYRKVRKPFSCVLLNAYTVVIILFSILWSSLNSIYSINSISLSHFVLLQILVPVTFWIELRWSVSFILLRTHGKLGFSITAGIIYMVLLATKKIRYYMAKTFFEVILKETDS